MLPQTEGVQKVKFHTSDPESLSVEPAGVEVSGGPVKVKLRFSGFWSGDQAMLFVMRGRVSY